MFKNLTCFYFKKCIGLEFRLFQNVDPENWQIKDGCKPENVLGEKVIKELLKRTLL